MFIKASEKGQALILIALAAIGLFAFSALAIDGSRVFSDRRHAQNAADSAALAGALAYARASNISTVAQERAASNGYNNNGTSNVVTVTVTDSPSTVCPANSIGKDITVTIVSYVNTTFTRVIRRPIVTNAVTATSRACGSYYGPPFNGNAIVSLAPSGTGFDAQGTPDWTVTGGGIFVNSSSSSAATCGGAAGVITPGVTAVGATSFSCHIVDIGSTTTGALQVNYSSYSTMFPRQPACNGTASFSNGQWHTQSGADGSRVTFSGDQDFETGLYCVTNSPGPFHGAISGTGVTFYVTSTNFSMKFNGGGNLTASAPTSGEYKGILLYLAPQVSNGALLNTQEIDMRGNGTGDIVGSVIAPSADVTMFGNSGTGAFDSQVIAYQVDSGGNADINVTYQASDNYAASLPITLTLLQ